MKVVLCAIVVSAGLMSPTFAAPSPFFRISGAPGPIAGAGLPALAVGYGVYWLIKRSRKAG